MVAPLPYTPWDETVNWLTQMIIIYCQHKGTKASYNVYTDTVSFS